VLVDAASPPCDSGLGTVTGELDVLSSATSSLESLQSCCPIRSRANTARGLSFDHMIKREHTREV
jgi:hypothetical protein